MSSSSPWRRWQISITDARLVGHPEKGRSRALITATYGPVPVLRELFTGVEDADRVLIYGS